MSHHIVTLSAALQFATPGEFASKSHGYARASIVDEPSGGVQMGFGIARLDQGGSVATHLHSYEESFFVMGGSPVLDIAAASYEMVSGDYGLVPVGVPHAWRNSGDTEARWADMSAPMPRPRFDNDTYFTGEVPRYDPVRVDPRDPRNRLFGHIDAVNMEVGSQTQDRLAMSASMRTALLVYSGITVKMMIDSDLGADLSTMFMVQYEPGGFAGAHDHPLEEAYLILEGQVDAVFDGEAHRMSAGDIAWAGVGCVHEFSNPGPGPVRWLETQAPQPPPRHSYRFKRDWSYLETALAAEGGADSTAEGEEHE